MANDGSLPLEMLEDGDLAFIDALREVHDADALGAFAAPWFEDRRPSSRRLLFSYLDRPLNAFRHEGLIKRLFKKAEAEGDDPLMARFLVLFDRSIRRVGVGVAPRRTTMPRGGMVVGKGRISGTDEPAPDWAIRFQLDWSGEFEKADIDDLPAVLEQLKSLRLFSVATRNYLRRRAWRYFRKLGKTHPDRYIAAASEALGLYRDDDMPDGLALIDNWGLVHLLFQHSPALEARPNGWTPRAGHSLAELAPAPSFPNLWENSTGEVVGLLTKARSKAVRRWAIRRVKGDLALHRPALPLGGWLDLLGHPDPGLVALAAEVLDGVEGLETLGVDRWLALAESTAPSALEALCERIGRHVRADQVTLEQATRLARLRPLPVARLGFSWLEQKPIGPGDLRTVLALVDAECEAIRPEVLGWLRGTLAGSPGFEPSMVLDFLDSPHADVRLEGWNWYRADPRPGADLEIWRKLLESPHDDIRLALVATLDGEVGRRLDPEALRHLWASVLLGVDRGSRAKPGVVRQLLRRLEANPSEAPELLPLLGLALRSSRGPERRAGLVAVVRLAEAGEEMGSLVRSSFPELQMG